MWQVRKFAMRLNSRCRAMLAISVLAMSSASAETAYVKDEILVPLRSGPSSQHRILHKGIRSNTVLTVLAKSEDNNWINVRTPSQLDGWLPAQYVVSSPTASIKLASLSQKFDALSKKHEALQDKYGATSSELNKTKTTLTKTESAQQKSTMELHRIKSISSGAIELDQKYQKLLEDHELLQTANDALNAENTSLKNDRRFSYMFYGAMLVITGMFMAVILPRLKMKKRHSEWAN